MFEMRLDVDGPKLRSPHAGILEAMARWSKPIRRTLLLAVGLGVIAGSQLLPRRHVDPPVNLASAVAGEQLELVKADPGFPVDCTYGKIDGHAPGDAAMQH
jgi:hypothetical protein